MNKTGYINFIKKNLSLTDLQKKSLIELANIKLSFFKNTNSNLQIQTFYKEALKTNNIKEIFRLKLLFIHFITTNQTDLIFDKLNIYHELTDEEVIQMILNKNSNKYKSPNVKNWDYAIEYLCFIYKKLNKAKTIKYIDICSGSGKKTKIFSKYLNIKKEDTYCTDIKEWGPYEQNNSKYPFQFKYIKDEKLDYEDNSFDLATCILSLHHIKNLDKFIKEIYRIIKPNGYLLFIDHSVFNDYDRLFINIQHLLYSVFYDKKTNYIENPDFIYCYNMYEWNYIMNKNKLSIKKQDSLSFDIQFQINYDNIFYSFYQKKN